MCIWHCNQSAHYTWTGPAKVKQIWATLATVSGMSVRFRSTLSNYLGVVKATMPTRRITRVARRTGKADVQSSQNPIGFASLVDFMSVLQQTNTTLLPILPQKGTEILGRGLSGVIKQSTADMSTNLAFKEGIPSKKLQDTELDQDWSALITEITILQHEPIKTNPHIIDLLGVAFAAASAPPSRHGVWPLVVTSKVNHGDLTTVLQGDHSEFLTDEARMSLFAGVAEAIFVLHSCGRHMTLANVQVWG